MTGSITIDIVIGLIFVYLLYSLFATIIAELISTTIALRASILHQGIVRMLEDEPAGKFSKTNRSLFDVIISLVNAVILTFKDWIRPPNNYSTISFYNHPLVKYSARNRVYSKPSYIEPSIFSKVILDLLKKGNTGTPLERIKAGLKSIQEEPSQSNALFLSDETRKLLYGFLEDADFNLVKFQIKIEEWFNLTMERTKGWFKRKNRIILIIIGFVLACQFNVSTFDVVEKLSTDKDAREQLVQLAVAYTEENPDLPLQPDTTDSTSQSQAQLRMRIAELHSIREELQQDVNSAHNVMGFAALDSIPLVPKDSVKDTDLVFRAFGKDSVMVFPNAFVASKTHGFYSVKEVKRPARIAGTDYHANFVYLDAHRYFWHQFFGYLVTALAISLGANFWFDLLNKMVKLRTSVQPDTSATSKAGDKSESKG